MNRKQQGDVGVAMAIAYYTKKGYGVSVPLTDNLRYDLIVDSGEKLLRVQVKCTARLTTDGGDYELGLRTAGGNQSWNKISKKISSEEADLVFAYVLPLNRMYEFPVDFVAGRPSLRLGAKVDSYVVSLIE